MNVTRALRRSVAVVLGCAALVLAATSCEKPIVGHDSLVRVLHAGGRVTALRFLPDGAHVVAAATSGGVIHVWDLASGREEPSFTHRLGAESLAVSRAGNALLAGDRDGVLAPFDAPRLT